MRCHGWIIPSDILKQSRHYKLVQPRLPSQKRASKQHTVAFSFFFFFLNTRTMNSFSYYNAHECLQGTKQVRVTGDKFSQQADSCGSNTICAMLKTKKKDRSAFCCFQFSVSCMSGGGVGDFLCSSLTAGLCASSPHTSQAS